MDKLMDTAMSAEPTYKTASEPHSGKARAPVAMVICGILRDEIEAVVKQKGLDYPMLYLAPAPCISYETLQIQLGIILTRASEIAEKTLVVIGRCHPNIDDTLARYGAIRLPMNNCFEALLGASRLKELLKETNTFFTTPSWLKHWRRALEHGMKWDEVDTRQNFGVYERTLILDAGVTPYTDEEVLAFFDYTQVPVDVYPIDLSGFANLLVSSLDGLLSRHA